MYGITGWVAVRMGTGRRDRKWGLWEEEGGAGRDLNIGWVLN